METGNYTNIWIPDWVRELASVNRRSIATEVQIALEKHQPKTKINPAIEKQLAKRRAELKAGKKMPTPTKHKK